MLEKNLNNFCCAKYTFHIFFFLILEFALKSDLSPRHKLNFVKRKVELMQEFGTVQEYRQAWDQLKHYKNVNAKELKAEAKKRQELEREELKLKDLEVIFFILFSRKNCSFFIIYILFFFRRNSLPKPEQNPI